MMIWSGFDGVGETASLGIERAEQIELVPPSPPAPSSQHDTDDEGNEFLRIRVCRLRSWRPRPKAWDESPDMPAIFPIEVTKSSLQPRLLDERNVDEIEHHEADCPNSMGRRQQRARFTEKEQHDSGNHRITDELIRSANDERTWRIPRCERALPLGRKPPHRGDKEDQTPAEQREADHLEANGAD